MTTINTFELSKYLGLWYQFASTPNNFEPSDSYNTTAEYTLDPITNKVLVYNKLMSNGKVKDIRGELIPTDNNTEFQVKLYNVFLWFSVKAPYNILAVLADANGEYTSAIVGGKKYIFILTREKHIDCTTQAKLKYLIKQLGYNWDSLIFSPQICE